MIRRENLVKKIGQEFNNEIFSSLAISNLININDIYI